MSHQMTTKTNVKTVAARTAHVHVAYGASIPKATAVISASVTMNS